MIRPAPAAAPIHYPSSDGKPMAENDVQRDAIMYGSIVAAPTRITDAKRTSAERRDPEPGSRGTRPGAPD